MMPRTAVMGPAQRQATLVVAAILALTVAVYLPVRNAGFITDDESYVEKNADVRAGLTTRGVLRAFTVPVAANWHPLTMLSLMLDAELFGPGPRGFHLMNVGYHLAAAALAFLVLRSLTGAVWRSAAAAAIFAVHPLHVESVAWISERKDVLSGICFWLALGAYRRYAARPSAGRHCLVGTILILGLMAKPMLVTVPLLFLLLDFWPLGRLCAASRQMTALAGEKLPWLAISAAFSVVAVLAQLRAQALQPLANLPFAWRVQNALLSCVRYLETAFWPARLSFFHPLPYQAPGIVPVLAALAFLASLTALALFSLSRHPALAVGWFWYLGLLVPVIGLVQVGGQTVADRYMYLPLAGVALAILWPVGDALRGRRRLRVAVSLASVAVVVAFAKVAHGQAGLWESGVSLFTSSLERSQAGERWLPHYALANVFSKAGDTARALRHVEASIALNPGWTGSRNYYAGLLLKEGRAVEALAQYREAIRLWPDEGRGYQGEGRALAALGRNSEAVDSYRSALERSPGLHAVRTDLGVALAQLGRLGEAESAFRAAALLLPEEPLPPYNLGLTLAALGRQQEAIEALRVAVQRDPGFAEAFNDLGAAYATAGQSAAAARAFAEALRLKPDLAAARDNLARLRAAGVARP